jgi:feruloyl esterase
MYVSFIILSLVVTRLLNTFFLLLLPGFDYADLAYATSLHFAAIASDNGHSEIPVSAAAFLNQPEMITDFSHRGAHVSAVIGKQVTEAFYGGPPSKSYYLGCSAGGRQGAQFALKYPDVFDGILAGAPAVNWNRFMSWTGMLTTYGGQPLQNASDTYVPPNLWKMISQVILQQCDDLDGLADGLIADPDACVFDLTSLHCPHNSKSTDCLTPAQVNALYQFYTPLRGTDGEVLFPRFDPGAEADVKFGYPLNGLFTLLPQVSLTSAQNFDIIYCSQLATSRSLTIGMV